MITDMVMHVHILSQVVSSNITRRIKVQLHHVLLVTLKAVICVMFIYSFVNFISPKFIISKNIPTNMCFRCQVLSLEYLDEGHLNYPTTTEHYQNNNRTATKEQQEHNNTADELHSVPRKPTILKYAQDRCFTKTN